MFVFLTYYMKLYETNGVIYQLPVKHHTEYFIQFQ